MPTGMWRSNKQTRLPKLRSRFWLIGLVTLVAVGITGVVAGQAVGPMLLGSATGSVGVVSSQSLTFFDVMATRGHEGDIDQATANVDTSHTSVVAAFRMHRHDDPSILTVAVRNSSDTRRSAYLTVSRPTGFGVNVERIDPNIQISQMDTAQVLSVGTMDRYLVVLEGEQDGDLDFAVQVGGADPLGTHTVTLTLEEIA